MTDKDAGPCPLCGNRLEIAYSGAKRRFIICENGECGLAYPLPFKGTLEYTAEHCPISGLPLFYVERRPYRYFWTNGPCFECKHAKYCGILIELKEEYI